MSDAWWSYKKGNLEGDTERENDVKDNRGEATTGIPTRQGRPRIVANSCQEGPGHGRSQFNGHSHLRLAFKNKRS